MALSPAKSETTRGESVMKSVKLGLPIVDNS
jgi:hypothetical protein